MSDQQRRFRLAGIVTANFALLIWWLAGGQPAWLLFPLFGILVLGSCIALRKSS
jgi:hypothetical protein